VDCRNTLGFFVSISALYDIVVLKLNFPENMNISLHSIYDNIFINEIMRLVEVINKNSHSSTSCNHSILFVLIFDHKIHIQSQQNC